MKSIPIIIIIIVVVFTINIVDGDHGYFDYGNPLINMGHEIAKLNSSIITYQCPFQLVLDIPSAYKANFTQEELSKHFAETKWIDPRLAEYSCVDGRSTGDELGTPGGDSGEFLLALAVMNSIAPGLIEPNQVESILSGFLDSEPGSLYLHTDDHAEDRLLKALQDKYPNSNFGEGEFDIEKPTLEQQQQQILSILFNASYMGCGHIRLMIQHPDIYEIPLELTRAFIEAFFTTEWSENTNKTEYRRHDFVILEGDHEEKAILSVKVKREKISSTDPCYYLSPMILPKVGDDSFFLLDSGYEINHGIRKRIADYFTKRFNLNADQQKSYSLKLSMLASKQGAYTFSILAPTLPTIESTLVMIPSI